MGVNIGWLEGLCYGFLSGLTEFLPVSTQAHQRILCRLFGVTSVSSFMKLLIHIAVLLALLVTSKVQISGMYRQMRLRTAPRRNRRSAVNSEALLDIALIRTAFIPLALGFFFYPVTKEWGNRLYVVALCMILNGVVLLVPSFIRTGNKDARSMTRLDSLFFGICSALGVIPGISRIAMGTTAASIRGADTQCGFRWAWMLSIPAMAFLIGFDVYGLIVSGVGIHSAMDVIICALSGISAYLGAYLSIRFARFLAVRAGYSGFAFYSFGAGLFTFFIYLTIL